MWIASREEYSVCDKAGRSYSRLTGKEEQGAAMVFKRRCIDLSSQNKKSLEPLLQGLHPNFLILSGKNGIASYRFSIRIRQVFWLRIVLISAPSRFPSGFGGFRPRSQRRDRSRF